MAGTKNDVLKVVGRVGVTRRTRASQRKTLLQANTLLTWAKSGSSSRSSTEKDGSEFQAGQAEIVVPVVKDELLEPHGQPLVWAEDRVVLGDALPWFHSVQGGCYYLDNICRGVLIDGDCGDRSYIDDEVVITRVGGSCKKTKEGKLIMTKDHDPNGPILRSLINSMRLEIPVGLILGGKNTDCRTKVPYNFNVLDFFRITDIWFEQVGKHKGAQMRFEKISLATKSWWSPKGSPDPIPLEQRESVTPSPDPICPSCSTGTAQVFAQGWMCLNPLCAGFWKMEGSLPPSQLTFAPEFLAKRSKPKNIVLPPCSLVPDLLSTFFNDQTDVTGTRMAWKGIVCPQCRACIARIHWRRWECSTAGCGFQYSPPMNHVSLRSVLPDLEMSPSGHRLPTVPKDVSSMPMIQYMKNYRKDTFVLPGAGIVTHFAANRTVNSRPGGPDDLFSLMQVEDLGLRRYPISPCVVAGTLTSHFAVNYGMPYKYIVSVDSRPFNTAPPVIISALERLKWATRHTVDANAFQMPNELLALGYFEDMSIGYHDDGESSLGPTIATLSLGAPATMLIRMKDEYYNGFRKRDGKDKVYLQHDPVLPGCANEEARAELSRKFNAKEITAEQYLAARQALPTSRREAPPICTMALNHGDLAVMHGPDLQKYYEHSVIPSGRLRFALTARYVMPDQVPASEHWKGDYDPIPEFEYDGDET
ncbi:Oxoglutarate/iron-dependent dioxygenase [Trichophyton interdigitale]|uniref:Oxoglutarate/iron-dependent dioxygenase n=1 Tax=Trichophyton interdigitale TaxID=101480 RepID=A0A9P5CY16_9EURO|nr:Oxoglutarate/iron-dependent dioxygenase [Trichophyton interdigitale]KAF3900381.1 Oxoglutarate/iron-dependent dioxygenase [Trichophyton interdigitale]KAG8209961.1 Oxoglutarate/iron-dependent dioxygenase [Trichophyton interdigitale]